MVLTGTLAQAFPAQDDHSPGTMAVRWNKRSNAWARFDLGVFDGKVTSSPPDATKFDRRIETLAIAGADTTFGSRFGARINVKAESSKRRQAEEEEPKAVVDETQSKLAPSLDLTFVTDKGLELFAGMLIEQHAAYTQSVTSANVSSETKFKAVQVDAKRFGVVRRAGAWTGGFYYLQGSEKSRDYDKSASDGSSIAGTEKVFIPSRIGVFGDVGMASFGFDFELAFIQARGLGPKDERNASVFTDYFEARLGGTLPLGSVFGLKGSVLHKTLSYASNTYVSFDTIPMTSLKLVTIFGNEANHAFLGVIGATGSDGQSQPEFNAQYEAQAAAVTSGLNFSF